MQVMLAKIAMQSLL